MIKKLRNDQKSQKWGKILKNDEKCNIEIGVTIYILWYNTRCINFPSKVTDTCCTSSVIYVLLLWTHQQQHTNDTLDGTFMQLFINHRIYMVIAILIFIKINKNECNGIVIIQL